MASYVASSADADLAELTWPGQRKKEDYIFAKTIGSTGIGIVYLAKDIHTREEVVIKVFEKYQVIRENKLHYIDSEKNCLDLLAPVDNGFVKLLRTFKDNKYLYLVLSYAKNGDLSRYITKAGSLPMDVTKFYAAELLLAIESMHARNIVHRDLRPENIMLNESMHLEITQFGLAKILQPCDSYDDITDLNFSSNAQYISPELLHHGKNTKSSDLWSFGCILYNMMTGLLPFKGQIAYVMFKKILERKFIYPEGVPGDARDIVEKLIDLDYKQRLGAYDNGNIYQSIRNHPFFEGIDWDTIWLQTPPKICPSLPGDAVEEEYIFPDHLEPGLGPDQLSRLWDIDLSVYQKDILSIPPYEYTLRLEEQAVYNKWHRFVDGQLILKQGLVIKGRGLFARERMLLLTTGPRLLYVNPFNMIRKGEISWSSELRVKAKTFKLFCIYTPNRKYYLKDPAAFALEWVRVINEVHVAKYGPEST